MERICLRRATLVQLDGRTLRPCRRACCSFPKFRMRGGLFVLSSVPPLVLLSDSGSQIRSVRRALSGSWYVESHGVESVNQMQRQFGVPFFIAADDGIAAGEPTECFNPIAVVMRAEALSRKEGHVGAVAFSRTGDPATGNFQRCQGDQKIWRRAE